MIIGVEKMVSHLFCLQNYPYDYKFNFCVEQENQQPAAISDLQQNQPQYNDSPVFYGPDGKIITEEESSFLNSNMPESYPINIDEIIE